MKKYIKIIIIICIAFIIGVLTFIKASPSENIKNKIYKEYGLKVKISEIKKQNTNTYKCIGNIEKDNIKFNVIYEKEKLSFNILSTNIESKFHKFLFTKLNKKHKNLSVDGNCYILTYKNYKDITEAALALEHISNYLQKQNYFKNNGNICFIKIMFEESLNKNITSTEFVYGKIKESTMDYYKDKIYNKDTAISKMENNYIEGTKKYNQEDDSIISNKFKMPNNIIICGEKGSSVLENYKGYFTFNEAIKILKDLKIEVVGNEDTFIVLSNGSTFEFSKTFIDGPHTYYVVDGNRELLSTSENLISPLIFEKIAHNEIKNYNIVSKINHNETIITTPFYMNFKTNKPYLYVNDLPNLLKELNIELKKYSLYEKPFLKYDINNIIYEFDLSFSEHYRNQKGYFINNDNYFFKKDDEKYPLGRIVEHELSLDILNRLTNLDFEYDSINHVILIK